MTDDLSPYADEAVLAALTAPGTPAELAGEAEMLAAFRAAVPRRPRRRLAVRLGAGGAVFAGAVVLSGGVAAAAYNNSLPAPVQNVAHSIAGWAAVPAHHKKSSTTVEKKPGPVLTPPPAASSTAPVAPATTAPARTTKRHHHRAKPHKHSVKVTPSASATAAPTPTPTPTVSTTPTPTPLVPSALSASVTSMQVPANSGVTISGRLTTSAGVPVPNDDVTLYERPVASGTMTQIGEGQTDANGDVSFGVPALTQNVRLMLRAGGVHSAVVTVVETPTISVATIPNGTTESVSVSTIGATPGDTVSLLERENGQWQAIQTGQLDATGAVSWSIPTPAAGSQDYAVEIDGTAVHGGALVDFTVAPPS